MKTTTTSAVLQLHKAGAHMLRCDGNKRALGKWRHRRAPRDECLNHVENNGLVGIIPGSINAVVVDIDSGAEDSFRRVEEVVKLIGMPVCIHNSSKDYKYHLWYRWDETQEECRNSSWSVVDEDEHLQAAGEIRGTNGYVVMWNPSRVADHLDAIMKAKPVDLTPLLGNHVVPRRSTHTGVDLGDLTQYEEITYDKVEELLDQIDPDVDYQTWIMVGAAIQSKFPYDDGLHLWDNWSAKGEKYEPDGPNSPREKWGTFDPEGEVTIGTLFYYAADSSTTPEIPEASHVAASTHAGTPSLPKGYKRVKVNGTVVIKKTVKLEGGKTTDITVSDWDIYPVSYGIDEALGYETVRYKWNRPHVGWSDLVLRTALLNQGSREFPNAFTDQTGISLPKERMEVMQTMMRSFMKKIQDVKTVTPMFNTMGWKDDNRTFVIGDTLMRRDDNGNVTQEATAFTNSLRREKLLAFCPAGNADIWKRTTGMIERGDMSLHGLAIGIGLSAPLYHFAGLKGLVVSLYGETGGGKSLAQYWAQSVWGNPESLHIKANHTSNALYRRMGLHCHLPVTIDEVTMMLDKEVGSFCFNVSQGADRMRLDKNAEEQATNTWATPVIVSTNKSLQSKLTASGLETDAQLARLFEINVVPHPLFEESSDLGGLIYKSLSTNYGHVGRAFMQNILTMQEETLVDLIEKNRRDMWDRYGLKFRGEERYWEQMLNLADFALTCASKWDLISFDHQRCMRWVLHQVVDNREFSKDIRITGFDMLGEYLSEFNSTSISVLHTENGSNIQVDSNRIPRDTIRIRFDLYRYRIKDPFTKGILMVDRTHFKQWLASKGLDYTAFKKEMRKAGALIGPQTDRGSLGKNTSFRLKQSTVFRFDLSHPSFMAMLENLGAGDVDIKGGQV